jgi:tetratricopeptide (TPR) repeat protein
MRPKSRHNQYALVSLGNLHWKIAVSSPGGKSRDDNFKRAAELFTKALDLKPSNVYAANGLGIVCALRRNWKDARDIFLSTKQECNIIDVWGNLGIAYFELGQYASALNCIELCLPKSESNFDLLLLKAKCFFCQGKFERNDETVRKAIKEMEKVD